MPECRICFENGEIGDLISPCNCRGSTQWVHQKCLNEWRHTNQNARSSRQCEICLFNYIISYAGEKETYFININTYKFRFPFFEIFCSIILTFFFGNVVMLIDSYFDYQSLKDFQLQRLDNKTIITDNNWFLWIYYQGLGTFVLNILFYFLMSSLMLSSVIRKRVYFRKMLCSYICSMVYTMNFIFLIYLSKLLRTYSMFKFWSPFFSSLYFSFAFIFIKNHNQILNKMNDDIAEEVVHSFQLNPLNPLNIVDTVPITITDYVHNDYE